MLTIEQRDIIDEIDVALSDLCGRDKGVIAHFIGIRRYADMLAILEKLEGAGRFEISIAAMVCDLHLPPSNDIAVLIKDNEKPEGQVGFIQEFLSDKDMDADTIERVVYLVENKENPDKGSDKTLQVLFEARSIIQMMEKKLSTTDCDTIISETFKTDRGIEVAKTALLVS